MTERRLLPVPEGLDGLRIDVAVTRLLGLSRTVVADLVADGGVTVVAAGPDGGPHGPERTPAKSDRVHAGEWVAVTLPPPPSHRAGRPPTGASPASPSAPRTAPHVTVLLADDHIAVVDKPVGVAAHPSPGWTGPTVVADLAAAGHDLATSGAAERQGVVHRLDVGTTGLMVVAKSELAYSSLKQQFRDRTVGKTYLALVQGHPDPSRGTVDAPIDRHPTADWRFAVVAGGRPSVTHYRTVEAFRYASLLEIDLETGRTHQIRVHMAAIRHPCVGDLTYGADPVLAERLGLRRQWLHAHRLSFEHPATGEPVTVTSELPADLQHALDVLAAES